MNNEISLGDKTFVPYISSDKILARVKALAAAIKEDHHGDVPHFIIVLNGAYVFATDILRALDMEVTMSFVRLSSYSGLSSTGVVNTVIGLDDSFKGRPVIILEDIVDTGKTLHKFLPAVWEKKPSDVKIATFLSKPDALKYDVKADYVAFEIDNKFVVGYGLDYNELGRNLPELYILKGAD